MFTHTKRFSPFLFLLLLLPACDKNKCGGETNPPQTGQSDDCGLLGQVMEESISSNGQKNLDVDQDGVTDFQLKTVSGSSPSGSTNDKYFVSTLHNQAFVQQLAPQTPWYRYADVDTQINNGQVHIYGQQVTSCSAINSHYIQQSASIPQTVCFNSKGETITDDNWVQVTDLNMGDEYFQANLPNTIHGDTSWFNNSTQQLHCQADPFQQTVYLGIKVKNKRGWIELRLLPQSRIYLYGTAIEL